jgi:NAD+ synthase (glutamine-hydrolysing)
VIPLGIFTLKPSAELSDLQNPEKGGGDPILYGYHDRLFHAWQQSWNRASPEEILEWYSMGELEARINLVRPISDWFGDARSFIDDLERWWKLFKGMGVVKRVQAPPIVALSRRSFGFDYRESILQPYFSKRYYQLKEQLLKGE